MHVDSPNFSIKITSLSHVCSVPDYLCLNIIFEKINYNNLKNQWIYLNTWMYSQLHLECHSISISNLNLQFQSHWSLFSGMWQKKPRELDYRLRFETEQMLLHVQYGVHVQNRNVSQDYISFSRIPSFSLSMHAYHFPKINGSMHGWTYTDPTCASRLYNRWVLELQDILRETDPGNMVCVYIHICVFVYVYIHMQNRSRQYGMCIFTYMYICICIHVYVVVCVSSEKSIPAN